MSEQNNVAPATTNPPVTSTCGCQSTTTPPAKLQPQAAPAPVPNQPKFSKRPPRKR